MVAFDDEGVDEEARAVEKALAGFDVAGMIGALEEAVPWLAEVGDKSPGARVEALGTILVGYTEGRLPDAIVEWRGFLGPMRPWS